MYGVFILFFLSWKEHLGLIDDIILKGLTQLFIIVSQFCNHVLWENSIFINKVTLTAPQIYKKKIPYISNDEKHCHQGKKNMVSITDKTETQNTKGKFVSGVNYEEVSE